MSSNSTNATNTTSATDVTNVTNTANVVSTVSTPKPSAQAAFSRGRAKAANWHLTSEGIAADVAAFKKHGGRIEVLGTTPLRSRGAPAAFSSSAKPKSKTASPEESKSVASGK